MPFCLRLRAASPVQKLLRPLCGFRTTVKHANAGTLKLEISGNNLLMIRDNELHKFSNFFQAEQYAVGVFVHTVRNYLGPKWQPLRISITSTPDQPENCAMAKCCGELETDAEHCVVTVPIDWLECHHKISGKAQEPHSNRVTIA